MALSVSGAMSLLAKTPTALFPIALGLAGLGAGLRTAAGVHGLSWVGGAGAAILSIAAAVLITDIVLYGVKAVRARDAVADDLAMATRANLLAPGFMAGMVIGGQAAAISPLGGVLWLIATLGHLLLLLRFVGQWLTREYAPEELNPTWFLPAAGIMTAALSWPGFGPVALPAFTLAAGAMLWLLLLPLVFRRLVFEPALDPKLRPSLFILAAPFGLIAGGVLTLIPHAPAELPIAFLSAGAFFIVVLLTQPRFLAKAGITLTWWATTFPIAAVASGFLRLSAEAADWAALVGTGLLALAAGTTTLAMIATFRALGRTCLTTIIRTEQDVAAMQGRVPPPGRP